MMVYMWEDGQGYKIITQVNPSYFERNIQNRLQKHLYDRLF
jgi:hypothetical protein